MFVNMSTVILLTLYHHHHHHHHQNAGFRVAHNNVNYCWGTLHSQVTCWLQDVALVYARPDRAGYGKGWAGSLGTFVLH